MSLPVGLGLLALLIALQAFFVGSEMALTAIDRERLRKTIESGRSTRTQRAVLAFLDEPTWILGTTLLGVNACLAAMAAVVVSLTWTRLGAAGAWLTVGLLPLTLLLGEVLPKSYFQAHPFSWAARAIWPLKLLSVLFRPLLALMAFAGRLIAPPAGSETQRRPFVLREELKLRIQDQTSTPELGPMEREMLTRIFDFSETTVEDVMVPLIDVQAVAEDQPLLRAVEVLVEEGYSRLPVYRDRIDNVVGILYAFDVLYEHDLERPASAFMRTPYYVPESMPVSRLLLELRRRRLGMSIVVDEYGGSVGAVTLEDVLEEIVGEIEDEYDEKHDLWRKVGPDEYLVDARMDLTQLTNLTGVPFPEDEYETVAGLLLWTLGRIPGIGEVHRHGDLTFIVRKSTVRAIREVSVVVHRRSA